MDKVYKNKKLIKGLSLFEYLIVVAIVLNSNSIYAYLPINSNNVFNLIVLIALGIGILGCILITNRFHVKRLQNGLIITALVAVYILFYIFLRPVNVLGDFHTLIVCCLFLLYYFLCCSDNEIPQIILKYRDLIYLITLLSLIMWVLCSQLKMISPTGMVNSSWTDNNDFKAIPNYFYIYFETQEINFLGSKNIIRNSALFTEAPMCSMHFSIALIVELFLSKKTSKKRSVIFILGIVSTFSTTGYIAVLVALWFKFVLFKPTNRRIMVFKKWFVPISIVCVGILGSIIITDKFSTSSGSIRLDDYVAGYRAWCENIILGNGGGEANQIVLEKYMSDFRLYNTGFSNSIMRILSERGLYGGFLYLYCFVVGIYHCIISNDKSKLVFILFLVYLLVTTVMTELYITIFLLIFIVNNKKIEFNFEECCGLIKAD